MLKWSLGNKMGDDNGADFKPETIQKFLQLHFKDEKTKCSMALQLLTEILRVFVSEAAGRAAKQAQNEETRLVTIEHLEKILPQLLFDLRRRQRKLYSEQSVADYDDSEVDNNKFIPEIHEELLDNEK